MKNKPENKNHLKAQTLENFIFRYGSEDGKQKWDAYIQKLKKRVPAKNPKSKKDWGPIQLIEHYDTEKTICIENIPSEFIEKFELVWNELKDKNPKFDSIQLYSKTCKSLFSAKSQIKKDYWLQRFWSDLDAEEKANSKRQMQVANEEWYVKKYGEEKGKKLWSEKCASSNLLENWTKKFGSEKATEMWGEYRSKLRYAKSFDGWFEKYGGTLEEYQEYVRVNTNQDITISAISQELFYAIVSHNEKFKFAKFGENEQLIPIPPKIKNYMVGKNFFPDFLYEDKIIEFYGDYWHKNPKKYDDSEQNLKIRKYDALRCSILAELGYIVKIVWEDEYRENKEKVIMNCLDFLTKNIV